MSDDLRQPTRCLTPLLRDLEPETSEAIRHIAAATQEPVDLPRLPTMQVLQPDGSYRTVPMPATWHNPRHRPRPQRVSWVQRVLSWFGH